MNNITIDNISFSYRDSKLQNDKNVFCNYSASFPAEQLSVIMAPSGRGKTTLLYLLAGLLEVIEGSISYPVSKPRFSCVFQDSRLIEHISVAANLRFVNSKLSDEAIENCLSELRLDGYIHKKVKHLSGGEKQRVAIARALLAEYDILLMDEPFTGLDDEVKNIVINYIKSRTAKKTVLLVTHDKNEADALGGSVITL